MAKKVIKPAPYYSTPVTMREQTLATDLRDDFKDKIARSLPHHHIVGFKANHIVSFVSEKKVKYPFFLKVDIAKFYPCVRHLDLIVNAQVAYRDLIHSDYVPKSFKERYLARLNGWCNDLPIIDRGIPIGSPVSAILAPVMLVPLWLDIKARFHCPFIIYMDDVLFCCRDQEQCTELYTWLQNELTVRYDLSLNIKKVKSGRFSAENVDFCGWRFAGGYAGIAPDRIENFKQGILKEMKRSKYETIQSFLKRINRKIDGFGNYYKHGAVRKEFENLDVFVRGEMRRWLNGTGKSKAYSNQKLNEIGLHQLIICYEKLQNKQRPKKIARPQPTPSLSSRTTAATASGYEISLINHQIDLLEAINKKFTEMLSLQREQTNYLRQIAVITG
ncbi:MAG: hypothetical protein LBN93_05540 [Candidatus Symbiothrix sp.]|jgi:hypothetical protein|nr:hypothetical protein [Candidatus Symbiothrix sp.]